MNDEAAWVGSSIDDIYRTLGPWNYKIAPVSASKYHAVLYQLPAVPEHAPKPHYSKQNEGDADHVHIPYSTKDLFPSKNETDKDALVSRWELIQTALLRPFTSSRELETAINQYNNGLPQFQALHYFFEEVLEEEETEYFFKTILPKIINLALQLPDIVPCGIPLLKQGCARTLSLSQLQVSCLLANAFLCTFPWKKENAASYPIINFYRLYAAHAKPRRRSAVAEKLKCICHYFRRVLEKPPTGVITFERKHIYKPDIPRWDQLENELSKTKIHVSSQGKIESNGLGMLQVDFANKRVGGGVIGTGCVQEEIRFVICPELIVSRLFVEQLGDNEALLCIGAERYSDYDGYGDTFTWSGNHNDKTPFDSSCRRKTNMVAIDATRYSKPSLQYNPSAILRELNKAYAGFHSRNAAVLSPVATGNWGCGAFKGDARLKSLIQLMACSAANRDMVYFTFEDVELRDDLYNMYRFLSENKIAVSQLWKYFLQFCKSGQQPQKLYSYIQQAHFDSKRQPSVKTFFGTSSKNVVASTSGTTKGNTVEETIVERMEIEFTDDEDDMESSQTEQNCKSEIDLPKQSNQNGNKLPTNHDSIAEIMRIIDGDIEISGKLKNQSHKEVAETSKREDRLVETENVNEKVEESLRNTRKMARTSSTKSKITDYFSKLETDKPK